MECSKLPWKINSNGDGYQVQSLDEYETWVAMIIQGIPSKEQKANAEFIVTACNEHDTLKAKAELFDEIHEIIKDGMRRGLEPSMPFALIISKIKSEEFLAKAKEIK